MARKKKEVIVDITGSTALVEELAPEAVAEEKEQYVAPTVEANPAPVEDEPVEAPVVEIPAKAARKFQIGDRVRLLGEPRGVTVVGKIINYNLHTHAYRVNGVSTTRSPKGIVMNSQPISKVISGDRLELIEAIV